MDSQSSSLSTIDKIILSSQHYVDLPCFAPPGWCNCCPDPSETMSETLSETLKEMPAAADLSLCGDKENATLSNSGEIQGEMVPAKKKKLSLTKGKLKEQLPSKDCFSVVTEEALQEATKAFCPKNTIVNNTCKWAVNNFSEWIEARQKKSGEPQKSYREILFTDNAEELSHWLCTYDKELRKENGGEYTPKTLYM